MVSKERSNSRGYISNELTRQNVSLFMYKKVQVPIWIKYLLYRNANNDSIECGVAMVIVECTSIIYY